MVSKLSFDTCAEEVKTKKQTQVKERRMLSAFA